MIGEYDDSGQLIQEYGWKPQGLWSTDPLFTRTVDSASGKSKVHYYLIDQRGQPQRAFTRNSAITWQARSDSYGQTTINDKSALTSNLRLPGQYYDSETGLHYNWFRYYDPSLGRCLRNDPTGLYGGLNAYAYGLSNPLTYIDNSGQLENFALQAVWWRLRQAGAAYIRCFGQCLVSSATEATIGELWQYMMGDCEPGFEFSGMAVLAMQNCGYSCLNPRNWGGKRAKTSKKSKAYENRAHGMGGKNPKAEANRVTNSGKNFAGKQSRTQRLKDLVNDDKVSSADRGWIRQEMNEVAAGKKGHLRNPPEKDLAHERGRENAKGYGYEHVHLQNRKDHRSQHKLDNWGKHNKERPVQ